MCKPLTALLLLACAGQAMAEGDFSLAGGFDYSTGKYGRTTSTDILYVPVVARYTTDTLAFKLTVPYIRVTSIGNVVRGFGVIRTSTSTKSTTQSGLGDITGSAAYTFYDDDVLAFDVAGIVKFGTASASKGLGTGENDYAAQLDAFYTLSSGDTLFATVGHKIVGAPEGVTVNNVNYGTLGLSHKFDEKYSAGLMLGVSQSPTELSPGTREVTAYLSNNLDDDLKLQLNVMKGLSDASPDWGCGMLLTSYF